MNPQIFNYCKRSFFGHDRYYFLLKKMKETVKILESFTDTFCGFLDAPSKKRVISLKPSNTRVRCTYEHKDQKVSWRLIKKSGEEKSTCHQMVARPIHSI